MGLRARPLSKPRKPTAAQLRRIEREAARVREAELATETLVRGLRPPSLPPTPQADPAQLFAVEDEQGHYAIYEGHTEPRGRVSTDEVIVGGLQPYDQNPRTSAPRRRVSSPRSRPRSQPRRDTVVHISVPRTSGPRRSRPRSRPRQPSGPRA